MPAAQFLATARAQTMPPGLLQLLLGVFKLLAGDITTADELKQRIAALLSFAEIVVAVTPTTADNHVLELAKQYASNDAVIAVLFMLYRSLVNTPTKLAGLDAEQFGAMLAEAAENAEGPSV